MIKRSSGNNTQPRELIYERKPRRKQRQSTNHWKSHAKKQLVILHKKMYKQFAVILHTECTMGESASALIFWGLNVFPSSFFFFQCAGLTLPREPFSAITLMCLNRSNRRLNTLYTPCNSFRSRLNSCIGAISLPLFYKVRSDYDKYNSIIYFAIFHKTTRTCHETDTFSYIFGRNKCQNEDEHWTWNNRNRQ